MTCDGCFSMIFKWSQIVIELELNRGLGSWTQLHQVESLLSFFNQAAIKSFARHFFIYTVFADD